jgi:hypothetical protein
MKLLHIIKLRTAEGGEERDGEEGGRKVYFRLEPGL